MNRGFGSVNTGSFDARMKLTIVLLVTVVFVAMLAATLFVQQGPSLDQPSAQALVEADTKNLPSDLEILVARTRVEEGAALNPTMFDASTMDEGKIPMGALRKRDIAQINGKFAARLLQANVPVLLSDITEVRPANLLSIPSGYRAVTINVDSQTGVEGFAKPNTRVDILFTYTDQGRKKVSTIVRFIKVLSVGGVTAADADKAGAPGGGATTITLLVSERDAKKIELAKKVGELSLSLVGDQEEGALDPVSEEVSMADLIGGGGPQEVTEEPEEPSNVMYVRDPKSGALERYVLNRKNKWIRDNSIAEVR